MAIEGAQEYTVEIDASQADCFEAILDFESYPQWSSAVKHAAILERDGKGVGRIVEFRIDLPLRSIRYVLEYSYRRPSELTWKSVDGDIESIEGAYEFKKRSPKLTETSCRQAVRLGFWLPGPLRTLVERTALRDSVEEFKREVERRVAKTPEKKRRK